MDRKIDIIEDLDGRKIVMIQDIRFKGKRKIDWKEVEQYLKKYILDLTSLMNAVGPMTLHG